MATLGAQRLPRRQHSVTMPKILRINFNLSPEAPGHSEVRAVSISGEAVEQAGAARGHQIRLTATSAWVRRIPRRVATAGAIMMAYHCATRGRLALSPRVGSAARPVGAGGIDCITPQCIAV